MGYLPGALLNFMALNGWNPGGEQEIFTLVELIENLIFQSSKRWWIFNPEKLDWLNKEHIKLLPKEEIEKNILEWLPENMRNPKLVPVILERISKWGDIKDMVARGELNFFLNLPNTKKQN